MDIIAFLADNFEWILSIVVGFLCFFVTLLRTGSVKKAIKNLKEYEEMLKYKTALQAMDKPPEGQTFSNTVPDYILDPVTNELERSPIDKDVQAYIDSHIDVALDRALEKFLPKEVINSDDVADYTAHSQDLAVMGEAFELAEHYRDVYHLDDNMSVSDIYNFVGEQADKMKNDLLKYNQSKEIKQDVESKTQETK